MSSNDEFAQSIAKALGVSLNDAKIQFPVLVDCQVGMTDNKETQTVYSVVELSSNDKMDVEIGIVQLEITRMALEWMLQNFDLINYLECYLQFVFLNETVTTEAAALKTKVVYDFLHVYHTINPVDFLKEIKTPTQFSLIINDSSHSVLAKGKLNMTEINKFPNNKLYSTINLEICLPERRSLSSKSLSKFFLFGTLLCSYQVKGSYEIIEKYFPRNKNIHLYSPVDSSFDFEGKSDNLNESKGTIEDGGSGGDSYHNEEDSIQGKGSNYKLPSHQKIGEEMELLEKKLLGSQSLLTNVSYPSQSNDPSSKFPKKPSDGNRIISSSKLATLSKNIQQIEDANHTNEETAPNAGKHSSEEESSLATDKMDNSLKLSIPSTSQSAPNSEIVHLTESEIETLKNMTRSINVANMNSDSLLMVPFTIMVHKLTLFEDSQPMKNPHVQQLYIEVHFLNFIGEEMESPTSIPKPKSGHESMNFEFSITFTMDIKSIDLCKSLLEKSISNDSFKILLISEPTHNETEVYDCEEVGIFQMKYSTLLQNVEDVKQSPFPFYNVSNPTEQIGEILLSFLGINYLKKIILSLAKANRADINFLVPPS